VNAADCAALAGSAAESLRRLHADIERDGDLERLATDLRRLADALEGALAGQPEDMGPGVGGASTGYGRPG
jgi:hypothetical protein